MREGEIIICPKCDAKNPDTCSSQRRCIKCKEWINHTDWVVPLTPANAGRRRE